MLKVRFIKSKLHFRMSSVHSNGSCLYSSLHLDVLIYSVHCMVFLMKLPFTDASVTRQRGSHDGITAPLREPQSAALNSSFIHTV